MSHNTYIQGPLAQNPTPTPYLLSKRATYQPAYHGANTAQTQHSPQSVQQFPSAQYSPSQLNAQLEPLPPKQLVQQAPQLPPPQQHWQQLQNQQQQQPEPLAAPSPINNVTGIAAGETRSPQQQQQQPAQQHGGRFNIFRRRGSTQPPQPTAPGPARPTASPAATLHPPEFFGGGRPPSPAAVHPTGPPRQHYQLSPPSPLARDAQPMQELIGGNWLFVIFMPYFIGTALQDTHLRIGLIVSTVLSCAVLVAGLLVFVLNLRKVFPHILEVAMPVIYTVQLGVSYHSTAYEREVIRTYPFITHSALAGVCLVSMLICFPVGYQTAQELVHKMYMTHPAVHRVGLYTTAVLIGSLVTSCLLYLAPLCRGVDDQHWSALNLIFRLIYPPLATLLALLFVRLLPDLYLPNLAVVHGLNRKPQQAMSAYLYDAMVRRPPAILDASMFQSVVDAAAKAREAAAMEAAVAAAGGPRWTTPSRPSTAATLTYQPTLPTAPHTPQYSPGGSVSPAPSPAPAPYYSPAQAQAPTTARTPSNQLAPWYGGGNEYGSGPAARYSGEPHSAASSPSVYTYYAAGPPAKPPLAVYAVYGDSDTLPVSTAQLPPPPAGVQPLTFDGGAGKLAPYSFGREPPAVYGGARRRYMGGGGGGAHDVYNGSSAPQYGGGGSNGMARPVYGRNFAGGGSTGPYGSAGPYGVQMPLGEMAAAAAAADAPRFGQPDAVITGVTSARGPYHRRPSQQQPQLQPRPYYPDQQPQQQLYTGSVSVLTSSPPPPPPPTLYDMRQGPAVAAPASERFGLASEIETTEEAATPYAEADTAGLYEGGVPAIPDPPQAREAYGLQAEMSPLRPPPGGGTGRGSRHRPTMSRTAAASGGGGGGGGFGLDAEVDGADRVPSHGAGALDGESFGLDVEVLRRDGL